MIKYNSILWLKSLKMILFVAQLVFLTLIITCFIIAVFPPCITADSALTIGSYVSDKIVNSIATGFKYNTALIVNYAFIVVDFFLMLIIVIALRYKFHYNFQKKIKHHFLDTILNFLIIIFLAIFTFSPLQVQSLDFQQVITEPKTLNFFWDYSGSVGILDFEVTGWGLLWMILFCIIAMTSIVNYLNLVRSIINHKYF